MLQYHHHYTLNNLHTASHLPQHGYHICFIQVVFTEGLIAATHLVQIGIIGWLDVIEALIVDSLTRLVLIAGGAIITDDFVASAEAIVSGVKAVASGAEVVINKIAAVIAVAIVKVLL